MHMPSVEQLGYISFLYHFNSHPKKVSGWTDIVESSRAQPLSHVAKKAAK